MRLSSEVNCVKATEERRRRPSQRTDIKKKFKVADIWLWMRQLVLPTTSVLYTSVRGGTKYTGTPRIEKKRGLAEKKNHFINEKEKICATGEFEEEF